MIIHSPSLFYIFSSTCKADLPRFIDLNLEVNANFVVPHYLHQPNDYQLAWVNDLTLDAYVKNVLAVFGW